MRHKRLKAKTVKGALKELRQRIRQDGRGFSSDVRELLEEISQRLDDSDFNGCAADDATSEETLPPKAAPETPDWPDLERWRRFMMGLIDAADLGEFAEALESRFSKPET